MRWMLALIVFTGLTSNQLMAQSSVPIDSIASMEELVLLVDASLKSLDKSLADDSAFEEKKGKAIRESFGMLSCLGQAIAEHSGNASSEINGPALRDAALQYNRKGTYDEAKSTLAAVHEVLEGKVTGEHEKLHPWNQLINMHPMMEEMNAGNSANLKVLRRIRGKPTDTLGAVTWSLLAIAMKADTHEVKNPDDLPKWNTWSDEFQAASLKLADAIRAKDSVEGRKWFDNANETCDACHEVFQ